MSEPGKEVAKRTLVDFSSSVNLDTIFGNYLEKATILSTTKKCNIPWRKVCL